MVHASRGPDALMVRRADGLAGLEAVLADTRRNAVLIGPAFGTGKKTCDAVHLVLRANRATVLDADALTSFAGNPASLAKAVEKSQGITLLTPHEAEFERLFGQIPAVLSARTRAERARAAAFYSHAFVVLKGAETIIAAPDGRLVLNTHASPWLATAGSGDVLAGTLTGLLAQAMPPFKAACAAVYVHGAAGLNLGERLIADELPMAIRMEINRVSNMRDGT